MTLDAIKSSKYLQLQLYLEIATKCLKKVKELTSLEDRTNSLKFNKEQCEYLVGKLESTMESAYRFFHAIYQQINVSSIVLDSLLQRQKKVKATFKVVVKMHGLK